MAASWPLTSGATRTSVVRTTPTTGGDGWERQSRYPPTPAAITTTPSAIMRAGRRLAMRLPPPDEKRGNHRERGVDHGKCPEAAPIARHFPQARTKLLHEQEAAEP